jgi:hypothetical protein
LLDLAQSEFAIGAFKMATCALRELQRCRARQSLNKNPAAESSHARQC